MFACLPSPPRPSGRVAKEPLVIGIGKRSSPGSESLSNQALSPPIAVPSLTLPPGLNLDPLASVSTPVLNHDGWRDSFILGCDSTQPYEDTRGHSIRSR